MGVIRRVREIVGANVNAMLDKAEDPEKLINLLSREMEDTLIELKAAAAGAMAARKKMVKEHDAASRQAEDWDTKANLAVTKGRDDLAREALVAKRRCAGHAEALTREIDQCDHLVNQYQVDIAQVESKLETVREKRRVLVQRHQHARQRKQAQHQIRKVDTSQALTRFERFESRVDQMEAEAQLVNYGRKPTLEQEIDALGDASIEEELQAIKAAQGEAVPEVPVG